MTSQHPVRMDNRSKIDFNDRLQMLDVSIRLVKELESRGHALDPTIVSLANTAIQGNAKTTRTYSNRVAIAMSVVEKLHVSLITPLAT